MLLSAADQGGCSLVNFAPPSKNPANSSGDAPGAFREIFDKFLKSSVDDMLPAKVVAYDRAKNRATVKILIAMVTTNGVPVSRSQLASVPVFNIGGGNSILSFNLNPGDLGWVKACDRDISNFLKSYKESAPATKRVHDFNNGVLFPDVMTGYNINAEDSANAVLQTTDGLVRISLFPDKLKITAPTVEISAETHIGGVGGMPIARLNDIVEVTVTGGSSAGTYEGFIKTASTTNTAT